MSTALEDIFDVCAKTPKGKRAGNYATATCSKCKATSDIFASSGVGARTPPEPLNNKFRKAGWLVGKRKTQHVCPDCKVKDRAPKADPPPVATPAQRRAILDTLEIVFDPEKGFDKDYDDQKVADGHGAPRKWVTDIREDLCGPIPVPKVDPLDELLDVAGRSHRRCEELFEGLTKCRADLYEAVASSVDEVEATAKAFAAIADKLRVMKKEREK